MQSTVKLVPGYLKAALVIAAKGDIRYYLNAVKVEIAPRETRYVGCDGHKLILLRGEIIDPKVQQAPAEILIPREAIELAVREKYHEPTLGIPLVYDAETPTAEARLGSVFFKPVEGKYPDYRKVIPKQASGERGSFNPHYLMHFHKAATVAFGNRAMPQIWQNGDAGALVLDSMNPDFVGVVMPMRDDSRGAAPSWAVPAEPAPAPVPVVEAAPANAPEAVAAAD
jgi:DNA polymerase-3 subunit beta